MTTGMRHFGFLLLSFAMMWGCGQSSRSERELPFKITGKLENDGGAATAYLSVLSGNEFIPLDTTSINGQGEFIFEGKIPGPDIYRVSLENGNGFVMVIDAPNIALRADMNDVDNYQISGSEESVLVKELLQAEVAYVKAVSELEKKFLLARKAGRNDSLLYYQEKYQQLQRGYTADKKDFIRAHPRSFVAAYATHSLIDEGVHGAFIDSMLVVFNKGIPQSRYVQLLNEATKGAGEVAIGAVAPEISLPQPDGTPLALSSLQGQYVLVDFWASWCRPCREENPEMVKRYQQYKDQGFEILGVSLDESREQWLQAIEEDGLPWRHVSDLQGAAGSAVQSYKVQAIPMTVLLDKEGKIMAMNLRGEALGDRLREIFGESR